MRPYENWQVIECLKCETRKVTYGAENEIIESEEDFECCHGHGISIIPQDRWSAEDWATICENVLEDANRHSFVDLPRNFLNSIQARMLTDEECREVMSALAKEIWDCI